jgi:hypothetical protein
MEQADRLDTLLDMRLRRGGRTAMALPEEDATVEAALAAADFLLGLRFVEPQEAFARDLETQLLAHVQTLATVASAGSAVVAQQKARPRLPDPAPVGRRRSHRARPLWPLIAASVILCSGSLL